MSVSINDFLVAGQHEIFAHDISERINELGKAPLGLPDEAYDLDEDEEAELGELTRFADEVERVTGKPFDEAVIVPEGEFQEHARDWAYGVGDFDFLDTYVDWAKFADDLRGERYREVRFGSDRVFVR